jgi:hypothetical protein
MKKWVVAAFLVVVVLSTVGIAQSEAGGRVFVGVGVGPWWGYGYGWGPGYPWYYPPYPAYYTPPTVVVQSPPVYVQQTPALAPPAPAPPPAAQPSIGYWYYCPSTQGYYPNVQTCPEAWVKVPPRAP